MKILICSDGHEQAERAIRFIAPIAARAGADADILGIIEHERDEAALVSALDRAAGILRENGVNTHVTTRSGEPVAEIRKRTRESGYDLVVIGAERKKGGGLSWMSEKAYNIIKLIEPPVLAVIGRATSMRKIVICSGGRRYIDNAVGVVARLAGGSGAMVTILHVMAEPPAMYAGMIREEEDVAKMLASQSDLGRNLLGEKKALEDKGIPVQVRLRHGLVVRELFEEIRKEDYDMVVTGSSRAAGPFGSYIMGDVTSEIVNWAECPVLVVRGEELNERKQGFLSRIFGLGGGGKETKE